MAREKKVKLELTPEEAAAARKLAEGLNEVEVPAEGLALLPLDVAALKPADEQQSDPEVEAYADQLTENDWYADQIEARPTLESVVAEINERGHFIVKQRDAVYDVFTTSGKALVFGVETVEGLQAYR